MTRFRRGFAPGPVVDCPSPRGRFFAVASRLTAALVGLLLAGALPGQSWAQTYGSSEASNAYEAPAVESPTPGEAATPPEEPKTPAKPKEGEQPEKPAPPPPAPSALQLKAGNANVKFGFLVQPQANWQQDAKTRGYQQNLFVRRVRIYIGGQFTKDLFFSLVTDNANLGKAVGTTKTISTGFQWLDAAVEWRPRKEFNLEAGFVRVPLSREGLKATPSEFLLDFSAYAVNTVGNVLGASAGRDTGFMARGYFAKDRFEYRVGAFGGLREAGSRNPFRWTGRVQYNVFDTEVYNMPSYPGSYLGTKKILALGTAYDMQRSYKGYTADAYWDIPISAGAVLGTLEYQHLDGGTFVAALGKSNILQFDAGLFIKKAKLGPWVRYEQRKFSPSTTKDEKRYVGGLNYYAAGHNFNIKAGYARLSVNDPKIKSTSEFTIQLQAYYF
jgi:hypothetical protein